MFFSMPPLLLFALFIVFCLYAFAGVSFAPWVPTRARDMGRVRDIVDLRPGEKLYELGSGEGRITLDIAKHTPDARCTGIEFFPFLWLWSRIEKYRRGTGNARFLWGDFFRYDLSDADVVFFFGMPDKLRKNSALLTKLARECPDARVVSYAFAIEDWTPETVDRPDENSLPIYRYRIRTNLPIPENEYNTKNFTGTDALRKV